MRHPPAATAGTLTVQLAGRPVPVSVAIVAAEIDPASDHVVTPLGARGAMLLLSDSYASRGQGMARCQAGHETWVRLIDTRARAERWSKRVESCLHDIEPGDPIGGWTGAGRDFTINMVSEPSVHGSVAPNGRVELR